jgi:hypothetical protein
MSVLSLLLPGPAQAPTVPTLTLTTTDSQSQPLPQPLPQPPSRPHHHRAWPAGQQPADGRITQNGQLPVLRQPAVQVR